MVFFIPSVCNSKVKHYGGTITVVTNFRNFNLLLKHEMSLLSFSKIEGMIRWIKGFAFFIELDVNMDYYHIKLDA
jgi:hypothetical protein